jgi:hypothetical protein
MTPLERELRALGAAIAYPATSPDFAAGIQTRLEREPRPGTRWWRRLGDLAGGGELPSTARPLRRALVLALLLLLVVAAIAVAIGLGVPGIRIVFGPGPSLPPTTSSTSASPGTTTSFPPGSGMGLGVLTPFEAVEPQTGFAPRLPAGLGPPAASYLSDRRLVMVWPPSSAHPRIATTDVGLLVTEFQGSVDTGYYEKIVHNGTTVEEVQVSGHRGYWLAGEMHALFYVDANGRPVDEQRLAVGQVLIWSDGDLTYRLETEGSKEEAITLAESIR